MGNAAQKNMLGAPAKVAGGLATAFLGRLAKVSTSPFRKDLRKKR